MRERWLVLLCAAVFVTWVVWWVVPVRKTAPAIYSLRSPDLDCFTAELVFVSALLKEDSKMMFL